MSTVNTLLAMVGVKPDDALQYGVRGMKWGERKANRAAEKKAKQDELDGMDNAQLQARINRLNLEKQYNTLNKRDLSGAEKFVKQVLAQQAQQTVGNLAGKYMKKGLEAGIKLAIEAALKKK